MAYRGKPRLVVGRAVRVHDPAITAPEQGQDSRVFGVSTVLKVDVRRLRLLDGLRQIERPCERALERAIFVADVEVGDLRVPVHVEELLGRAAEQAYRLPGEAELVVVEERGRSQYRVEDGKAVGRRAEEVEGSRRMRERVAVRAGPEARGRDLELLPDRIARRRLGPRERVDVPRRRRQDDPARRGLIDPVREIRERSFGPTHVQRVPPDGRVPLERVVPVAWGIAVLTLESQPVGEARGRAVDRPAEDGAGDELVRHRHQGESGEGQQVADVVEMKRLVGVPGYVVGEAQHVRMHPDLLLVAIGFVERVARLAKLAAPVLLDPFQVLEVAAAAGSKRVGNARGEPRVAPLTHLPGRRRTVLEEVVHAVVVEAGRVRSAGHRCDRAYAVPESHLVDAREHAEREGRGFVAAAFEREAYRGVVGFPVRVEVILEALQPLEAPRVVAAFFLASGVVPKLEIPARKCFGRAGLDLFRFVEEGGDAREVLCTVAWVQRIGRIARLHARTGAGAQHGERRGNRRSPNSNTHGSSALHGRAEDIRAAAAEQAARAPTRPRTISSEACCRSRRRARTPARRGRATEGCGRPAASVAAGCPRD